MNSLTAHRVVIGILVVLLGLAAWRILSYAPLDGNPIGFDLGANKQLYVALTGYSGNYTDLPPCMNSTNNQLCFMSFHYLQINPTPTCPPATGSGFVCPQGAGNPRALPACPPSTLCIAINAANSDTNSDMTIQSQDGEGGVHLQASTIGELELLIGPAVAPIGAEPKAPSTK
jgi:hypothetical protein